MGLGRANEQGRHRLLSVLESDPFQKRPPESELHEECQNRRTFANYYNEHRDNILRTVHHSLQRAPSPYSIPRTFAKAPGRRCLQRAPYTAQRDDRPSIVARVSVSL